MDTLLLGLAALACPIGMGVMMFLMMRRPKDNAGDTPDDRQQQVDQLRAELEQLKAQRATEHTNGQR